ncbi:hypothetical protein MKO06_15455 [Gramella sp. GC03-9]|uniref:Uncharacterized protein n=1 Tax=Christiangramia oceanisediminis TaxID=2920386 RepID=A0A9X2KZN2_9FLAO|nr:hypothetical protein [Gramella oceanisediminis]MCP9201305.1 hypothetical protein [Gramella oceanisediminis]
MKRFKIYRSIREQAVIFGLSVNGFAVQMIAVIGGLLMIIFSFSLFLIFLVLSANIGLYLFLLRFKKIPELASTGKLEMISNKEIGFSSYEN